MQNNVAFGGNKSEYFSGNISTFSDCVTIFYESSMSQDSSFQSNLTKQDLSPVRILRPLRPRSKQRSQSSSPAHSLHNENFALTVPPDLRIQGIGI